MTIQQERNHGSTNSIYYSIYNMWLQFRQTAATESVSVR